MCHYNVCYFQHSLRYTKRWFTQAVEPTEAWEDHKVQAHCGPQDKDIELNILSLEAKKLEDSVRSVDDL